MFHYIADLLSTQCADVSIHLGDISAPPQDAPPLRVPIAAIQGHLPLADSSPPTILLVLLNTTFCFFS